MASLALGTDDAFVVSGLEPRENQIGGGAIRWTRPAADFRFEGLGPGFVDVDLDVRDHRTEVTVTANGAVIGTLKPGERHLSARTRLGGSSLILGIETEGFSASSRTLGTQFVSLEVRPGASTDSGFRGVPSRLWLAFTAVTLGALAILGSASLPVMLAPFPPLLLCLLVLPAGLWRSTWLVECAALLIAATLVSALVSKVAKAPKGRVWGRAWLQVAILLSLTVHGILPPSPLVIQGDAQLHGNKLGEVARGNRFPVSRTDHKPPFEFPYGFSFYEVLSPLVSPELSNVRIVREGAAFFWCLSLLGLALILGRTSAVLAAVSVLLWTFAPVNIRTMGFGNLSNVFAQAIFVLFLVTAVLMPQGLLRATALTVLVTLSATSHLSSFIVLATLLGVAVLFPSDRRGVAFKPLVAGVLVSAGYYLTFLPMVVAQLPRLLGERGGSAGVFDPWRLPLQILAGAGWPLLVLLALSILVSAPRMVLPLGRSLAATGLLLAVVALVSPIEVRYLLAVMPVMVVVAATVFHKDEPGSFPGQTLSSLVDLPWLRRLGDDLVATPIAVGLVLLAVHKGLQVLLEFVPLAGV